MKAQIIREEKIEQPFGGGKTLQIVQMAHGGFGVKILEYPKTLSVFLFSAKKRQPRRYVLKC